MNLTLMPEGRASITAVANGLGIHPRTLQRRLDEDGAQFSEILSQLRNDEAERHLTDRKLSLAQVATRLGFCGEAAFSRWHRSQTRESPSSARKHLSK